MRTLVIISFLVLALLKPASGQALPPAIRTLVSRLAWKNEVQGSHIGFAGVPSPQYGYYQQLAVTATTPQLAALTSHASPAVRCYAFWALCRRPDAVLWPILQRHLTDNARVRTFFGCVRDYQRVGDLLVRAAASPATTDSLAAPLSPGQLRALDSLLLFRRGVRLWAREQRLATLLPTAPLHQRLRQLAARAGNRAAPIALARYRDSADVRILQRAFRHARSENDGIKATELFPSEAFYPVLLRLFEREWGMRYYDYEKWQLLYLALSRYPRPETLRLFIRTTQAPDTFRRQTLGLNLAIALRKYPHPYFAELLPRLDMANPEIEEYLQENSAN